MTFDDEVRRVFDALGNRVRETFDQQLNESAAELAGAATAEIERARTDAAAQATAETEARVRADAERDVATSLEAAERDAAARLADAVASAEARAHAEADANLQQARADAERVRGAADATLHQARADAGRAQVEAAEARAETTDLRAQLERQSQSADEAAAAARADAARSAAAADRLLDAIRAIDRARSLTEILDTFAGCAAREAARVSFLVVRGDTLRVWRFVGFGGNLDDRPAVDVPLEAAGLLTDAVRSRTAQMATVGDTPSFAPLADGQPRLAVPLVLAGEAVAVLYADQDGSGDEAPGRHWTNAIEVMARHASRALEVVTAFTTARALSSPAASDGRSTTDSRGEDHESARRYARLLVSEIRLYHEAEVVAGRRDRDLASRLGGEIARARVLYEQRVPPRIRSQTDYFQAELVRTLADGDAALLELRT